MLKFVLIISSFLLFVQLPCSEGVKKLHHLAPWTPIDWRTLPKANPDDFVEVIYLIAPLLEDQYGDLLRPLKAYHGAIAFNNLHNNMSITLNYDADDIMRAALFPQIKSYSNGSKDLIWDNDGGNFIYMGINETYWDVYNEIIGIIDGNTYNDFMSGWNANVNDTYLYYDMFSIMNHFGGTNYFHSWTCFDYVFAAFDQLYEMGAEFDYSKVVQRDDSNIYTSSTPVNVTQEYLSNPTLHNEIVDLYELIELNANNMTIFELIITIIDVLEGDFYVRESLDYWRVTLTPPFFAIDAVNVPLPGQTLQSKVQKPKESKTKIAVK